MSIKNLANNPRPIQAIVTHLLAAGLTRGDIQAVTNLSLNHVNLAEGGHESHIPALPQRHAMANYLAFDKRAKQYVKGLNNLD